MSNKITDAEIENTPLPFGKYKGMTAANIAKENSGYIVWVYENVNNAKRYVTRSLYLACAEEVSDRQEMQKQDEF